MSSRERDYGGRRRENEPGHERGEGPYYRAARFGDERVSGRAYGRVQGTIFRAGCDLSAFRFQERRAQVIAHYVAVVGTRPPPELDAKLGELLAAGEPTTLTPATLALLLQRRAQAQLLGPWVEKHYRPKGGERP